MVKPTAGHCQLSTVNCQLTSSFSVLVVSLLLGLVGLALVPRLSVQLIPGRSHASVSVHCSMRETSPELTDMELTVPIERTLAQLRGVQHIRSTSGRGTAVVQVSLDKWTDPAVFRFEAATVLRQLYPKLPATASYPVAYLNRPAENGAFKSMEQLAQVRGIGLATVERNRERIIITAPPARQAEATPRTASAGIAR